MPSTPITAGKKVVYQDGIYTVRAVDGNVLELAYHTGAFFKLVHISSVIACPPPAAETAPASLPASSGATQGVGTPNRAQWMSIADFLTLENLRAVLAARAAAAAGKPAPHAAAAGAQAAINFGGCVGTKTVPDGNHGDNFAPASSQVFA